MVINQQREAMAQLQKANDFLRYVKDKTSNLSGLMKFFGMAEDDQIKIWEEAAAESPQQEAVPQQRAVEVPHLPQPRTADGRFA